MGKAKKTASGNWRVQVYDYTDANGKRIVKSFTADTKAEAEYLAAEFAKSKETRTSVNQHDLTVLQAIDKYILLKQNLSPTTLDGYDKVKRTAFQDIMNVRVNKLSEIDMQLAVNRESKRVSARTGKPISAKTVANEWGLLASALSYVCKRNYNITLPEHQEHIKELPDPKAVVQALKGTDIELPCLLAMWLTFSMSEIRGLQCSDIKDGYITINRVLVDTKDGQVIKENAKVETRLRKHEIPPYIMQLINNTTTYINYAETGDFQPLITMSRDKIVRHWKSICKENGWDMRFHDLRHMSASIMLALNIPEKYAMERGGWKTPHVMKSVYQHTLSQERKEVDSRVNAFFDELL